MTRSLGVLIAAAALAGCGSGGSAQPSGPRTTTVYAIDLDRAVDELRRGPTDTVDEARASAARADALARAVVTIRRRLRAGGVEGAKVTPQGEQIVVELPGLDEEKASTVRDVIARTGALAMHVVDHDAPFSRALVTHVGMTGGGGEPTDPEARDRGISVASDAWSLDQPGVSAVDHYLTAADREQAVPLDEARRLGCLGAGGAGTGQVMCRLSGRQVLARYLDELGQRDPALRVPDDRTIGYERVEAADGRPRWRTYLLERRVRLTGDRITSTRVVRGDSQPWSLDLMFDDAGRAALAELTREAIGKKVAIVIDGQVQSAPVVMSAIPGGRLSLTMGGADRAEQERQARELADVLRAGALPAPLIEVARTQ